MKMDATVTVEIPGELGRTMASSALVRCPQTKLADVSVWEMVLELAARTQYVSADCTDGGATLAVELYGVE